MRSSLPSVKEGNWSADLSPHQKKPSGIMVHRFPRLIAVFSPQPRKTTPPLPTKTMKS
jgi:hypothetical protein